MQLHHQSCSATMIVTGDERVSEGDIVCERERERERIIASLIDFGDFIPLFLACSPH